MLRAAFTAVRRLEEAVLSMSILLIAGLTCLNVFTRTALGFSLAALEEVVQFLMLAVTFVGLSYAAGRGRHIRMTALVDALPHAQRKGLLVFTSATTGLLLAGLAVVAVQYVSTVQVLGTVSPALQVPLYVVYGVAPLGLALAAVQYGFTVARNLTTEGIHLAFDVPEGRDEAVQPGV